MLAHLNDIRNPIIISADATMDSEVVMIVGVTFYWQVNTLLTDNGM
jgi:hypothetical protein